jgi:hypothetical protein
LKEAILSVAQSVEKEGIRGDSAETHFRNVFSESARSNNLLGPCFDAVSAHSNKLLGPCFDTELARSNKLLGPCFDAESSPNENENENANGESSIVANCKLLSSQMLTAN